MPNIPELVDDDEALPPEAAVQEDGIIAGRSNLPTHQSADNDINSIRTQEQSNTITEATSPTTSSQESSDTHNLEHGEFNNDLLQNDDSRLLQVQTRGDNIDANFQVPQKEQQQQPELSSGVPVGTAPVHPNDRTLHSKPQIEPASFQDRLIPDHAIPNIESLLDDNHGQVQEPTDKLTDVNSKIESTHVSQESDIGEAILPEIDGSNQPANSESQDGQIVEEELEDKVANFYRRLREQAEEYDEEDDIFDGEEDDLLGDIFGTKEKDDEAIEARQHALDEEEERKRLREIRRGDLGVDEVPEPESRFTKAHAKRGLDIRDHLPTESEHVISTYFHDIHATIMKELDSKRPELKARAMEIKMREERAMLHGDTDARGDDDSVTQLEEKEAKKEKREAGDEKVAEDDEEEATTTDSDGGSVSDDQKSDTLSQQGNPQTVTHEDNIEIQSGGDTKQDERVKGWVLKVETGKKTGGMQHESNDEWKEDVESLEEETGSQAPMDASPVKMKDASHDDDERVVNSEPMSRNTPGTPICMDVWPPPPTKQTICMMHHVLTINIAISICWTNTHFEF